MKTLLVLLITVVLATPLLGQGLKFRQKSVDITACALTPEQVLEYRDFYEKQASCDGIKLLIANNISAKELLLYPKNFSAADMVAAKQIGWTFENTAKNKRFTDTDILFLVRSEVPPSYATQYATRFTGDEIAAMYSVGLSPSVAGTYPEKFSGQEIASLYLDKIDLKTINAYDSYYTTNDIITFISSGINYRKANRYLNKNPYANLTAEDVKRFIKDRVSPKKTKRYSSKAFIDARTKLLALEPLLSDRSYPNKIIFYPQYHATRTAESAKTIDEVAAIQFNILKSLKANSVKHIWPEGNSSELTPSNKGSIYSHSVPEMKLTKVVKAFFPNDEIQTLNREQKLVLYFEGAAEVFYALNNDVYIHPTSYSELDSVMLEYLFEFDPAQFAYLLGYTEQAWSTGKYAKGTNPGITSKDFLSVREKTAVKLMQDFMDKDKESSLALIYGAGHDMAKYFKLCNNYKEISSMDATKNYTEEDWGNKKKEDLKKELSDKII